MGTRELLILPLPKESAPLLITIHMLQRTSKILLVRLTTNKNALFFQIRVTCFARYTVLHVVIKTRSMTTLHYHTQ